MKRAAGQRAHVACYPKLLEYLRASNARCLWRLPMGGEDLEDPDHAVEGWSINGKVFVVQLKTCREGYVIFLASIDQTTDPLIALSAHCKA